MQLEKKVFCHWDLVRFVSEKHLKRDDGVFWTLSVTEGNEYEPTDKYVENKFDDVSHYEENDEFATFFFDTFEKAHDFVQLKIYMHPEYKHRPVQKIN